MGVRIEPLPGAQPDLREKPRRPVSSTLGNPHAGQQLVLHFLQTS
jgi:hypothetical protein